MKVVFFSIVLDGMPWVTFHYPEFRKLAFDWEWHVVEGVAASVKDTQWCRSIPPRLSNDGTTQYLDSLEFDSRVRLYRKKSWQGKVEMVNAPLKNVTEPCLLWEIDSDECWTADQLSKMRRMFIREPTRASAQFFCRYFVGPNIVASTPGAYGNREYDWLRVWRFEPGMRFLTHEPPVLVAADGTTNDDYRFTQAETSHAGLVFDHYAYALRKSVEFKQSYYGHGKYANAVKGWERLQRNQTWPARLSRFFSWVDDEALANRI